MKSTDELKKAVTEALAYCASLPDVVEAEVVASANLQYVARLNYTSHKGIPSNGAEELKSKEDYGVGISAVFKTNEGIKTGFGSEPNNISLEGVRIALEKAQAGAVNDPEFISLPKPTLSMTRTLSKYHDPALMELSEQDFVDAAWTILDGAIRELKNSSFLQRLAKQKGISPRGLNLILGGDLTIIAERFAVGSTHLPAQVDESTIASSFLTAMIEKCNAKGTGYGYYRKLRDISPQTGRDAAQNALSACGIEKNSGIIEPAGIPSGNYPIIFGPQPVSEFMNNLILPGLTTSSFYSWSSPFLGKMGEEIASPEVSIYDDAANSEYAGAKGITCEGLPTRRTDLIIEGRLNDLLSSWYERGRILRDPKAAEKLGIDPVLLVQKGKLLPASGFRFNRGGGRGYDTQPGTSGTNSIFAGTNPVPVQELISRIPLGLYIGRIWYCYPINGFRAGDFTATIIADSYIIKDGEIAAPLKANAARINDNIKRILLAVQGTSNEKKATVLWAADEMPVACDILVDNVTIEEIKAGEAASNTD